MGPEVEYHYHLVQLEKGKPGDHSYHLKVQTILLLLIAITKRRITVYSY